MAVHAIPGYSNSPQTNALSPGLEKDQEVKPLLFAILMTLTASFATAAADLSGFPRDEESLKALNATQLQIVHEAVHKCWIGGRPQGAYAKACVVNTTEAWIAAQHDPELEAFNLALPMHVRYDENWPDSFWQRLVVTQKSS